jgi:hypothetical protein
LGHQNQVLSSAMGQLDGFNLYKMCTGYTTGKQSEAQEETAPPRVDQRYLPRRQELAKHRALGLEVRLRGGAHLGPRFVVVQVEFERILKPVSHCIGSMVETGCFQARGQLNSTCTAPPPRARCGFHPPLSPRPWSRAAQQYVDTSKKQKFKTSFSLFFSHFMVPPSS